MAGDWIKMRVDLQTHPKIVRILSATGADKFRTIGGLHAVWSVFDAHSTDGILQGYTPKTMDHIIGWEGFTQAMIDVGWLEWDGAQTLVMPEFTEHNGKSGKRRAEDQKRKRNTRKTESAICPQSVRNLSGKKRTREEKSIKEKINKKESSRKTPLPTDFAVSDRVAHWAEEKGYSNLDQHLENFKLQAKSHNYKYVDWDAAFMNAIRSDWAKANQGRRPGRAVV